MKMGLKWLGGFLVLAFVVIALAAFWFLRWDELPPPELPGVVEGGVLEHDGMQRTWIAYVPESMPVAPTMLMVLHGSQSDGASTRAGTFYSFDVLAERNGLLVVYPEGFDHHWNDCRAGASYQANVQNVDDVGFLQALVGAMASRYGVDPARVFATGLSNGGQMVYRLAYEAPELLAGGAAIIASLPAVSNQGCEPSGKPVPMLILNGSEDPINPYDGGVVELFGDSTRGLVLSTVASAQYWARLAGHAGEGETRTLPGSGVDDGTSLQSLSWRAPGKAPVTLVTVEGGGHTFPNPVYRVPRILGPTSHQADGAELVWEFFKSLE